jgi:hypothetical protein
MSNPKWLTASPEAMSEEGVQRKQVFLELKSGGGGIAL